MSDDSKGMTRRIWLLLAKQGGRWSTEDIASELMMDTPTIASRCAELARYEMVVQYPRDEEHPRVRWGVLLDSKIPQGLTIRKLQECGAIKVEAA